VDYQAKIEEYRQILKGNISGKDAKKYRDELHKISIFHYVPQHTNEEYMQWMQENFPTFQELYSEQYPHYMQMFTIASQHVYGDSIYECLDKGMSVTPEEIRNKFVALNENLIRSVFPPLYFPRLYNQT
jgi:hypothetical protein